MNNQTEGAGIFVWGLFISIIFWIILWLLIGCKTTSHTYTQQSPVDERKQVIYTDGKQKGYLQQSPIDPSVTVQHDKNGNVEGTWKQSPIDPRKTIYRKKK